jgi:hypothetical protein
MTKRIIAKRKTIGVIEMIDYANTQLARKDADATMGFKEGICVMVEKIMFLTDSYSGFQFLDNNDCEIHTLGHASRKYYKPVFKK